MKCTFEILDWDSKFFNIKICRINGTIANSIELSDILKELKESEIDLVYYSSPIPLQDFQQLSLPYKIDLVDKKITYLKKITDNPGVKDSVTEFVGEYPDDKLIQLAIESGIYSRFNVDKKFGRSNYEAMYKAWIVNSVNKQIAKEVLVYLDNQEIVGFVTLGEKKSRADIGIIAVDANARGRGIGKSLMFSAENWFLKNDYQLMQVVTQGDNLAACKLYESCGYGIEQSDYFYHMWKE